MKKLSPEYLKFLLVGIFFTITGPLLFVLLARFMRPWNASLVTEIAMHSLRCIAYNSFVFSLRPSGPITYLTAAVPVSLLNIAMVALLQDKIAVIWLSLIIAGQGATLGFLWSKLCYNYNLSARLRAKLMRSEW